MAPIPWATAAWTSHSTSGHAGAAGRCGTALLTVVDPVRVSMVLT
jgi:hypothetical protein